MIALFAKEKQSQVCLDTDCSVTLTDKIFVKKQISQVRIRYMTTFLNVRDLRINKHQISKYFIAIIYFTEKCEKKSVRKLIRREMHFVKNLKANMLIENDILDLENICIDDVNDKVTISSCNNMIIFIEIRILSKKMIIKIMHVRNFVTISSRFVITILIHNVNLLSNRDFLFESFEANISLYAHIVNSFIISILTKNDSNHSVKISRNTRLEMITKIHYSNVFHVNSDDIDEYAEKKFFRVHKAF